MHRIVKGRCCSVQRIARQLLTIMLDGNDLDPVRLHLIDQPERPLQHFAQLRLGVLCEATTGKRWYPEPS